MSERERGEEGGRVRTALRKEGREGGEAGGGGAQLCRCIVQRRERVLGDK